SVRNDAVDLAETVGQVLADGRLEIPVGAGTAAAIPDADQHIALRIEEHAAAVVVTAGARGPRLVELDDDGRTVDGEGAGLLVHAYVVTLDPIDVGIASLHCVVEINQLVVRIIRIGCDVEQTALAVVGYRRDRLHRADLAKTAVQIKDLPAFPDDD